MRIPYRIMFCLAAAALVLFAFPATSMARKGLPAQGSVSSPPLPVITLDVWKNSTDQERRAFLMGVVTVLEMESAWQGKNSLPIEQSIVPTWVRGLSGVTIPEMDNALNEYMLKNPKAGDRSVLMVLGRLYVRPKLSQTERDAAAKHYDALKAGFGK